MRSSCFTVLLVWMVGWGSVGAVPVINTSTTNRDGIFDLHGSQQVSATLAGASSALSNYTIGIFDLNLLTADVDDPDFARQALQADRVHLLQEAGQVNTTTQEFSFDANARLALVVIYDATLREFSRGQNPFAPIFSVLGANGSHLINGLEDKNSVLFSFAAQNQGMLFGSAFGAFRGPEDLIQVQISNEPVPPITPEPATLALFGAGLLLGGAKLRRKRA